MLHRLAENLWHASYSFKAMGLPVSSRMTVVRLVGNQLWLHSPIPIDAAMRDALQVLGTVHCIVAPNKMHHLFVPSCIAAFPDATLYGARGLGAKRPDLNTMLELPGSDNPPWTPELQHVLVGGMLYCNETVWFHPASATLIVTDLLQWWQGDLPWQTRWYASLTGVRKQVTVPRTVRALVRDRKAMNDSIAAILRWPFTRVVMPHNAIIEGDAAVDARTALSLWISTSDNFRQR